MKTILASITLLTLALFFLVGCDDFNVGVGKDVTKVSDKAITIKGGKDIFVIDTNGDTFLEGKYCGTSTELQAFFAKLAASQEKANAATQPKPTKPTKKTKANCGGRLMIRVNSPS